MNARTRILVVAAIVLTLAAGCGSSGSSGGSDGNTEPTSASANGSGPTDEEISQGYQRGLGYTEEEGLCAAKELRGNVSDVALQSIADNTPEQVPADEVEQVQEALKDADAACR